MQTTITSTGTRKVFVDLWADETIRYKKRIVVEIPNDCDSEDIEHVGGEGLAKKVKAGSVDGGWERKDKEPVFSIFREVVVPTHRFPKGLKADLRIAWDDDTLVIVEDEE